MKNSNTPKDHPVEMEDYTCKYQLDKNLSVLLQTYGTCVTLIS